MSDTFELIYSKEAKELVRKCREEVAHQFIKKVDKEINKAIKRLEYTIFVKLSSTESILFPYLKDTVEFYGYRVEQTDNNCMTIDWS